MLVILQENKSAANKYSHSFSKRGFDDFEDSKDYLVLLANNKASAEQLSLYDKTRIMEMLLFHPIFIKLAYDEIFRDDFIKN